MAVTDDKITDWVVATGNNLPADTDVIGSDLGGQVRNIKGVVREDIDKGFTERQSSFSVRNISHSQNAITSTFGAFGAQVLSRQGVNNRGYSKYGQDFVIAISDSEAYKSFTPFRPFTLFTKFTSKNGSSGSFGADTATSGYAAHRATVLNSHVIGSGSGDQGALMPLPAWLAGNVPYTEAEMLELFNNYTIVYASLPYVPISLHPRVHTTADYPKMSYGDGSFLGSTYKYGYLEVLTTRADLALAGITRTSSTTYPLQNQVDMVIEECVIKVVNASSSVIENRLVTRQAFEIDSSGSSDPTPEVISGVTYDKHKLRLHNFLRFPTAHNTAPTNTWLMDGELSATWYRGLPTSAIWTNDDHTWSGDNPYIYTLEQTNLYWVCSDDRPGSQFNDVPNAGVHQKYIIQSPWEVDSRVELDSCGGDPVSSPEDVHMICGEGSITGDGTTGPYYITVYDPNNSWQTFFSFVDKELTTTHKVYEPNVQFQLLSTSIGRSDPAFEGSTEDETTENYINAHRARVAPMTLNEVGVPDSSTYRRGFKLQVYFNGAVPDGAVLKLAYMLSWPYALEKDPEV